ncbi:hypothetical protein, variant 1 [Verruconis gallopava]|uniref:Zn(2)-C6 fungal-type domain-containing protein n=2 Tax=Verruconis gallopava TaxID=253628 RepID=A0A0D1Y2R6_9PEZI|nr:hypothetical protein, variant 1 [Verruconis gallopava]KIW09341.1 hypothetical protein, variant 1 [Verruconis gallopava]
MELAGVSHTTNRPSTGSAEAPRRAQSRRESSGHLCTACDQCYRCKVKCSGEKPMCDRCAANKSACTYSTGKPLGKPKGSKNKVQRRKTSTQAPRQNVVPDKDLLPSPPDSRKRSADGLLPQPKRTMSDGPPAEYGTELSLTFQASNSNTPELQSLPSMQSHDAMSMVGEPLTFYVDSSNQEQGLSTVLEQPTPGKLDDGFPSAGLNLEIDDFKWFTTSQSEPFVAPTPTTSLNISTHANSVSGDSNSYHSFAPVLETSPVQLHSSTQDPPERKDPATPSCLCDPAGLGIISELHTLQVNLSPLDSALLLARRGLSTVSSYLMCPTCSNRFATSPSLFLACVLILQQVFACYVTLRMQGTRMLANRKRADSPLAGASICIGEFEVEGDESCNALLDAIVRSEIERGKSVIGTLEQWAGRVGDGKDRIAGVLLQSLREEIGVVS